MLRYLISAVILFGFASFAQARTWPQLALGGGFECVIIVSNLTNFTWVGIGQLQVGDEDPWATAWTLDGIPQAGFEFLISLPERGTQKIRLGGDSQARSGYLEIFADLSSSSSSVSIQFFYEFRNPEGALVDSTGSPEGSFDNEFGFGVERSSLINTGFALAPFFSLNEEFPILIKLFDSFGNEVAETTITFRGHQAQFFNEVFPGVSSPFLGSIEMEGQSTFFVTVLRQEITESGFQLTSIPAR